MPRMFKKVSCWPANDASGKSSAVAEERTATAMSSPPLMVSNDWRTSCSRSLGSSCSIIQVRIFLPVSASLLTSFTSSVLSSLLILSSKPVSVKKRLNAFEVVAKPPGTLTPKSDKWLIISPSEAFLPPTISMSSFPSWSRLITSAVDCAAMITPENKVI